MSDDTDKTNIDELAGRYIDLWQKHLAALSADGEVAELVAKSVELMNSSAATIAAMNLGEHENAGATSGNPWAQAGFQGGATAAGATHGNPDHDVDELTRRIAELEERVAELESRPAKRRKGAGKKA
ncbi:MAG: hypothetical protein HOK06_03185 [Rhodospirillaceae bacterium]|nr:hypothetical protein [Rhodospirillaceae bacterium]MBT4220573.1 hypothetical protein [Rhodospirillaceae bacterium]MBT4463321.1 hypothetical protein [Rhodospirillaceae bacterium]MBT5014053.1 hypothetical protein [Rhodospirillaceae bacterium]MBT5309479.1 hypothetical protein [Rhodospirillaceae bacterium]